MTTHRIHHVSSQTLAQRYLSFFRSHGHTELPGSALVLPGNSTSFVIAGMQPLLPYLRGQQPPPSSRLTSLQRCLRSDDVDVVGTNCRKMSTFHMLGNWSIGDYDKREAIRMAFTFLLEHLNLSLETLWVTVFSGDPELCLLPDETAIETWARLGIPGERIVLLGLEDNFWTMGTGTGPCGPCTEIYVDRGRALGCGSPTCRPGCSCDRFLEIWNLVFMEYERQTNGTLTPLPQRNIDTGMGLERTAAVLQDAESVFSIDLFTPAHSRLLEFAPAGVVSDSTSERHARRVIVDHTRAALLAGLAGIEPGRDGRNSVIRHLLRRAARQGRILGIHEPFLSKLLVPLAQGHEGLLTPEELQRVPTLVRVLEHEEKLFARVLTNGLRYLAQLEPDEHGIVSGTLLFKLHAEQGFPSDLAAEILAERGLTVDWSSYKSAWEQHRSVSRVSVETHFH